MIIERPTFHVQSPLSRACFHVMLAHIGSKVSWRQIKYLNLASPRVYSVNQRLTC
jgi:hypothetical protein